MSGITRFLLNLSIGAKLGIASGLGVLLVATMVIVQMRANAAMRDLDARMSGQQTIARDAVDAKASIRRHADRRPRSSSRQQSGRPAKSQRLSRGPAEIGEPVCRRDVEIVQVRRESRAHREAQGEGGRLCEGRPADRGRSRRSDRRGRRRRRRCSADCEAERRSRPHRPRSHAADRRRTRAARQPDRRIRQAQRGRASRPGRPGNGHGGMGIHGIGHRHDCAADRHQHLLLLHDRPSDARA